VADLFTMLQTTSRSLETQRYALDVVGQNIANVNTPGYARRVVDIAAVPPYEPRSAGSGAEVLSVRAIRDRFLDRRVREEMSAEQAAAAAADILALLETGIGAPGTSVDGDLDDLFDAFASLAEAPTSSTARIEVVTEAQKLAATFNTLAGGLAEAARDLDVRVRATVDQINALARQIADLNGSLAGMAPGAPEALHVRDQVIQALESLSALIDVQAVEVESGGFDVSIGSGRLLVVANTPYEIGTTPRDGTGVSDIVAAGQVITGEIAGGTLGGLLDVRDVKMPAYLQHLDRLAYEVAQNINAIHAGGYDLQGNPGVAFFEPLASVAGAAAALRVNGALSVPGGERLVAASTSPTAPGNNENARALAALRDQPVVGGTATFAETWAQFVYEVGRDAASASEAAVSRGEVLRQVTNLRDGVSGVSLDEEATNMLRFQRAYEANARYFKTVDELLVTLMGLVEA